MSPIPTGDRPSHRAAAAPFRLTMAALPNSLGMLYHGVNGLGARLQVRRFLVYSIEPQVFIDEHVTQSAASNSWVVGPGRAVRLLVPGRPSEFDASSRTTNRLERVSRRGPRKKSGLAPAGSSARALSTDLVRP